MTSRRQFISLLGLGCFANLPGSLLAAPHPWPDQRIKLLNLHTGERCDAVFFADGQWQTEGLRSINQVLRDHRANETCAIDPALIALVARVQQQLQYTGDIQIVSGYRAPKTNALLHAAGHRVAPNSLHMQGKALDLRLPGINLRQVQQVALQMSGGGVGYYGKDNFVHLDTGKVRRWG